MSQQSLISRRKLLTVVSTQKGIFLASFFTWGWEKGSFRAISLQKCMPGLLTVDTFTNLAELPCHLSDNRCYLKFVMTQRLVRYLVGFCLATHIFIVKSITCFWKVLLFEQVLVFRVFKVFLKNTAVCSSQLKSTLYFITLIQYTVIQRLSCLTEKLVLSFPTAAFDNCLHWYWQNSQEKKKIKEKEKIVYTRCKHIELPVKEENSVGDMSSKCPFLKRWRFVLWGCVHHLYYSPSSLEIECLHLTGYAWNDGILIDPGTLHLKWNCCAAKCGVDSIPPDRLIMGGSSLKPSSVSQDSDQLFFLPPDLFYC